MIAWFEGLRLAFTDSQQWLWRALAIWTGVLASESLDYN